MRPAHDMTRGNSTNGGSRQTELKVSNRRDSHRKSTNGERKSINKGDKVTDA